METPVQIAIHAEPMAVLSFVLYLIIIWNQVSSLKSFIYELVPAFLISAALTIIISLLTSPPKEAEGELRQIAAKYRH